PDRVFEPRPGRRTDREDVRRRLRPESRVCVMSRANFITTDRPVDYLILTEPSAAGPVIGQYAGRPIYAAVVDYFGRRFSYAGIAPRLRNGRYDVGALQPGEWIVEPGLIYFGDPTAPRGWFRKRRGDQPFVIHSD